MRRRCPLISLLTMLAIACSTCLPGLEPSSVAAQSTGDSIGDSRVLAKPLSTRFVPDDALAMATMPVATWFGNPMLSMFPMEVFRVQAMEQAGIDPASIAGIRAVVQLDPASMQPQFGAVAIVTQKIDLPQMLRALDSQNDPIAIETNTAYPISGSPGMVLCQVDSKTLYLGQAEFMTTMIEAQGETGELPTILKTIPQQAGLDVVLVTEQVRPIVSGLARQQSLNLPPALRPLAEIPSLTRAIKLHVAVDSNGGGLEIAFVGTDDAAAEQIETIVRDSLVTGRKMALAEMQKSMGTSGESPAMQKAIRNYANRMADLISANLTPTRDGDHVMISMESNISIASTGVLVGLLLPAVQAARQAARRMNASNNMKQIGLGLHNYHSAYRKLPDAAIRDADGNALLSWRVALLPFIEEQALYQQFRLDEPWDSPHNLPLSNRVPTAFASPTLELPAGYTNLHAVVDEECGFFPNRETRFRDFLDGLSNSILLMESDDESVVIWSKPDDMPIDLNNPLNGLGIAVQRGFHVTMGDGAVKFIAETIDPSLFRALLTRSGKEVIRQP